MKTSNKAAVTHLIDITKPFLWHGCSENRLYCNENGDLIKKERKIQILGRKLCSPYVLSMDLEILADECP